MTQGKTRILDATIAALSHKDSAKRAKHHGVQLIVTMLNDHSYVITSNGRALEQGEGDVDYATSRANERARAIRALGKHAAVVVG